jgi:methylenetetrahydrofolate reductase (NADPH)
MSKLRDSLQSGTFTLTSELGPVKGTNLEKSLEEVRPLKDRVAAFNVTDNQSSVMRIASHAVCAVLAREGMEPIYQLTCRDRNRLALQSDLLGAYVLGLRNVLALTGDHPTLGDHPEAMPVFDFDAVTLLETISRMIQGKDFNGNALDGAPADFFPGAVVSPAADPQDLQILKMEKKIEAGARFFQTQAVFDVGSFETFMGKVRHFKVPVLAGIILLKSPAMARFMNENVAGVSVPDALIAEMGGVDKKDRAAKSIEIAARLVRGVKSLCQGVHIMALGWEKHVPAVIQQAGL